MGKKRKTLSEDDRAVWTRVAASARPLTKPQSLGIDQNPVPAKTAVKPQPKPQPIEPFHIGQQARKDRLDHHLTRSISETLADAPTRMDAKTHDRMLRGQLRPEARIDLHGMTLAQAQPALTDFILSCRARGLRLVLVITGKGKDRDDLGPIPVRRGVLRHQVPHWLNQAPLAPAVLNIREAHLRHGGQGALYVYLRK